jgi:hypothetical protein
MIEKIIELLAIDEFYGQSELIDIAKGKYKIQSTIVDKYKQKKRIRNGRK